MPYFFSTSRRFMLFVFFLGGGGGWCRGKRERANIRYTTITKIHTLPHRLKHQAEMVFVEEVSVEPDTVELVISIGFVQLLKNMQLLETSFMPANTHTHTHTYIHTYTSIMTTQHTVYIFLYLHHFIVPDDLDSHLLVALQSVSGSNNVTEHTLTCVPVDSVATVQLLTNTNT